jgi:hypothetical protein
MIASPTPRQLARAMVDGIDGMWWPATGCVARIDDHWCARTRVTDGWLCTRCTRAARTRITGWTGTIRLPDPAAIRKYERRGRR